MVAQAILFGSVEILTTQMMTMRRWDRAADTHEMGVYAGFLRICNLVYKNPAGRLTIIAGGNKIINCF